MSHRLTRYQERIFRNQGYLVVEGTLSPEQCETAIEKAESLGVNCAPSTIMQPHRDDAYFLELLLSQKSITEPIEAIIGPPVVGLATQFYFSPQGSSGLMKHQDNYCVEAPDGMFASCWIPLIDVDAENGCLMVYPGTHKSGLVDVRPLCKAEIRATYPNILEEACVLSDSAKPVVLPLTRGTGVFLDGALVHESLPNTKPAKRYAFLATYLRKGAPFRPGYTAKREEVELDL